MEISYYQEYDQLCETAAGLLIGKLREKPDLLLCAATGNSPTGIYRRLVGYLKTETSLSGQLRIIKLDEWAGIKHGTEGSCEHYLRHHLVDPLKIDEERFISFVSDVPDAVRECRRISSRLKSEGPIDIAILGLGKNGHLGLNEPAGQLEPHCHLARLTPSTQAHPMIKHTPHRPANGMTLGMKDILSAGIILFVVSGEGKEEALSTLLSGKITTLCPASFLWLHDRVHCMVMQ